VTAKDGDRPVKFTRRLNLTFSTWQFGQNLPIGTGSYPFPDDQVDATGTDALVILTVYPLPNPWTIEDSDIQALALQMQRLTVTAKRRMFLRFAPEMNGNWFAFGQQPSKYIDLWKRVYKAVKSVAPLTAFVCI
jgi:hypothetical protein